MAVIGVPPYLQFFDSNGDPLSGGKIYTCAAGTDTPKATYTTAAGDVEADNPIDLDASGIPDTANGSMWLVGSYKFIVKDSLGNIIRTTDNVTSFTTLAAANNAYFQSFSGTGSQTSFTTSDDLGTDEKGLMIFVNKGLQSTVTNGGFTTDTDWTEGAGWTIAAGVATAAGAISTALSQTAPVTLIEGNAYAVTITITRSAGGLIPSIGGQNGTERTASGTYREVIVAGSSQIIAFTGNAFTGTLDNVIITPAVSAGYDILPPTAYTINGTTLTFTTAPAAGTNNIDVFAPSLLLGAASAAAESATASAAAALASQISANDSAMSAAAYALAKIKWNYSTTTTMADPGSTNIRLNNATIASATLIAISDNSGDAGNPDLSAWVNTWDDGSGSNRGTIYLFKDNANFALFAVNSANVDNTTWNQISVTYLAGQGTFNNLDPLYIGFAASGQTSVTGGITALTGDVTASGSGSVAATIANNAVTNAKAAQMATVTVKSNITGSTANAADNTLTAVIDACIGSTAQGDILYRNGTIWTRLGAGTNGQFLQTQGAAANPQWAAVGGSAPTTNTTTSGSESTFTVDFTNNFAYRFYFNGVGAAGGAGETMTVVASDDGGGSYETSTYNLKYISGTTTTASTAGIARLDNSNSLLNGYIDIWQDSTSSLTRFKCQAGANDGGGTSSESFSSGTMATGAACNRIKFGLGFDAGSISMIVVNRR